MFQNPQVAIVGRVPPPYGGVTVHLARLLLRAEEQGLPVRLYDLSRQMKPNGSVYTDSKSASWLIRFLFGCDESVVHLHTNRVGIMVLAAWVLAARSRRLVLTFHSAAPQRWYEGTGRLRQWLWRVALSRVYHVIC